VPIFYIIFNRQSAPGNDIGTTISLVCPRVFYFRPSCFVVGREFVRGRQHISKSARRVSARVLRRGCWAEGRRRCCCVFLCTVRVQWQPSVSQAARSSSSSARDFNVSKSVVSHRQQFMRRRVWSFESRCAGGGPPPAGQIILRAGSLSAVTF
jgi:hypothetical protein